MSQLSSDLTTQRDAILALTDALPDAQRAAPLIPDGWGVHEIIGHLSFWQQFTLNCLRDTAKDGRPAPLPPDSIYDDLNGRAVAQRKDWTWHRLRAEYANTMNALIERISAMDDPALQFTVPSPWVNDTRILTLETMVREDVLKHGDEHLQALIKWQNENN